MGSTAQLCDELAAAGRRVRDAVRGGASPDDARVVRVEGGDDVFGVDARADEVLVDELIRRCAQRWPGRLVLEGTDGPVAIGDPDGPWRYLADPVDGTRGLLAGSRSAWVLLGAGRGATTLEDLEVGAAVEIPSGRAALGLVLAADRSGYRWAEDDPVHPGAPDGPPVAVELAPRQGADLTRSFVTVVRLLPGGHGSIGAWADAVLEGLEVYDDLYPCSGGQLMSVVSGAAAAVLDPRPWGHPSGFHTHPYDLAAWVVARAWGVVVESLDGGPLAIPLDTTTPVAWAAYANETVADELRRRIAHASPGVLDR